MAGKSVRLLALLCGLVCVGSCHGNADERPPVAAVPASALARTSGEVFPFATYLHQRFGQAVPPTEHWYVVIPAVGCTGCGINELRCLAAGRAYPASVTVVTSTLMQKLTNRERRQLAQNVTLLADTLLVANNVLDRLNLPFLNLTGVVHTRPGQAPEYIAFDNDTYQAVFSKLPQK